MSEIKTLQERLEMKALNQLEKDLKVNAFMYENFKVIDMFRFVDHYLRSWNKDSVEDILNHTDLHNEGKTLFSGGTHHIPVRMRNIMLTRMLPDAIDQELKKVIEKLDKL